jgi:hypothetical protein
MGPKKSRSDIFNGATQGQNYPGIKGELPQFTIEICELNIDKKCNE